MVEKLLSALREVEAGGKRLSRNDLLAVLGQKSGHKPQSLKTYLAKNLVGVLVLEVGTDEYVVRGAVEMDDDLLELLMGQNNLLKEAAQNRLRWNQSRRRSIGWARGWSFAMRERARRRSHSWDDADRRRLVAEPAATRLKELTREARG